MADPATAPVTPAPQFRDGSKEEAFFNDEAGTTRTARGLRVNRFASIGKTLCAGPVGTLPTGLDLNLLNPLADPKRVDFPEVIPTTSLLDSTSYVLYVPPAVVSGTGEVRISLFYGVGLEVIRHGLRSFFAGSSNTVLILVPGVESEGGVRAWGIGITKQEIDILFRMAGLDARPWVITTMAGYSTGYRGLNGTINNTLGRQSGAGNGPVKFSTGLPLARVETVIYYDCFYRGDEPAPGQNTQNAIMAMDAVTNNKVHLVVYEVTEGGTPQPLRVPMQTLIPANRRILINLKPSTGNETALAYARMFDAAIADGYLTLASAPPVIRTLLATPPPARGSVASHSTPAPWKSTPVGTTVDAWGKTVQGAVSQLQSQAESLRAKFISNAAMQWMGWRPPAVGEIVHDSFVPEYAWEFLAG